MRIRIFPVFWFVLASLFACPAFAHGTRMATVSIVEKTQGTFDVRWAPDEAARAIRIQWPSGCVGAEEIRCPKLTEDASLRLRGFGNEFDYVTVDVILSNGLRTGAVASLDRPRVPFAPRFSREGTFPRYVRIGVQHILSGIDHVLFVVAIVALGRKPRRVLLSLTLFTVAHSVTLACTVLGVLAVPSLVAEAWIAVSLVLVGATVVSDRPKGSPWYAGVFGLVHGLGFAGALREIGFDESRLALCLFGFNIGVELGQLLLVLALAVGWRFLNWLRTRVWGGDGSMRTQVKRVVGYSVGSTGAYFTLQRLFAILGK